MGKVNIKLRSKVFTPDKLEQYRDYPALLKKYNRTRRYKQAVRIFMYSLIITVIVLFLLFISISVWKILKNKEKGFKNNKQQSALSKPVKDKDSSEFVNFI